MPAQMGPTLWQSIMIAVRVIWRVLRQLFHETTGVFFAIFALYGAIAAWREWKYHPTYWVIAFAILYAVMMAAFAFFAFRRARRIR
jgi:membrane associated rhomboid family serine protease